MSNAMSRSKSRWKGALLATVAGAAVSPLAAKATMTVGVYLNPIGSAGLQTTEYLSPDQNGASIPLYVYATVTGTSPVTPDPANGGLVQISTGNFDGLQYLYYNLNATGGNASGVTGGITATTLNSKLGFDSSSNDASGNASAGVASQTGLIDLAANSSLGALATVVAVGAPSALGATSPVSSSAMTQFAKPRSGAPVWSNYASYNSGTGYTYLNDGTNVIIGTGTNGLATNQVAFLVEKFSYTPSSYNGSSVGSLVSTSFSIGAPYNGSTSILNGTNYAPANSFNDSSQAYATYNSASGSSISLLTSSNYSSGHTATLIDTIPGDATLDGVVNFNDLVVLAQNYGHTGTTWAQGDFSGDGNTDFNSLVILAQNYGKNLGITPAEASELSEIAGPSFVTDWGQAQAVAAASVPEPASLGLLAAGAAATLFRRRRIAR